MDNGERRDETPRQVKLPIGDKKESGEGKQREKESNNKMWVVIIFIITIIASLVFSVKGGRNKIGVRNETIPNTSKSNNNSSEWFGPAKYEFGE